MSNRIDLTQFDGVTPGPWTHNPLIGTMVSGVRAGEDAKEHAFDGNDPDYQALFALPELIAELKRCYEREDALIEALQIIRDDLDDALETEGYSTLAHEKSERTLQKIRNFANDASE